MWEEIDIDGEPITRFRTAATVAPADQMDEASASLVAQARIDSGHTGEILGRFEHHKDLASAFAWAMERADEAELLVDGERKW